MLAGYRGNQFPVFENQLPRQHAVVLATNNNRAAFLQTLPAVEEPTLSVVPHPDVRAPSCCWCWARTMRSCRWRPTLALGKAALSGQSITVKSLEYPAPAKPYDAPRWITTQRPVKLAELVSSASELQLRGSVLNDTVNVYTRMAPDLFTWNAKGVPLDLTYRYTPNSVSDHGALNISINNQFIQSYPLQSREDRTSGKSTIMLPLFDDGSAQTRSDLKIPAFMIGGDNQLQFAFQIRPMTWAAVARHRPPSCSQPLIHSPPSTSRLSATTWRCPTWRPMPTAVSRSRGCQTWRRRPSSCRTGRRHPTWKCF